MKKFLSIALSLIVIFSLAACGAEAPATEKPEETATATQKSVETAPAEVATTSNLKPRTLIVSSQLATTNLYNSMIIPAIKEKLAEKTDGLLSIEYYDSATLCSAAEQLEACSTGMCDISLCATALFEGQLPLSYMLEFPTYSASGEAGSHAMMRWVQEVQPQEYADMGVTPLMFFSTGAGSIVTMDKGITSMDDFKGQEIRGNSMMVDIVNRWGGTGVSIPTNETYEAMRSGIVTGAVIGTDGVHSLALDTICNYYTYLPVFCAGFVTVINNDTMASLPEEWKIAVKETYEETFEELCWYPELGAQATFETLDKRGIEVTFLDDETLNELNTRAQERAYEYAAEIDAKGLNATEALERFHQILDECNQEYTVSRTEWLVENAK